MGRTSGVSEAAVGVLVVEVEEDDKEPPRTYTPAADDDAVVFLLMKLFMAAAGATNAPTEVDVASSKKAAHDKKPNFLLLE